MGKGIINSGGDRGIYNIDLVYADGTTENRSAWCADLTENLSGEIATAEVPGDTRGINILPGYRKIKSNYIKSRNGILTQSKDMSAVAATFNALILPGWQKYFPTYRYGTIKHVSYESEYCNVLLDTVYSQEQNEILPINQTTYLVNVPIEYMDCNAGAFNVGDEVLVEFQDQDWNQPVVIGFKEQPKECYWEPWNGPNGNSLHPWRGYTVDSGEFTQHIPWDTPSFSSNNCSAKIENGIMYGKANSDYKNLYIYLDQGEDIGVEIKEGLLIVDLYSKVSGSSGDCSIILRIDNKSYRYFFTATSDWGFEPGDQDPLPGETWSGIFKTEIPTGNLSYVELYIFSGTHEAICNIDGIGFR
jgi:hypothetical protein